MAYDPRKNAYHRSGAGRHGKERGAKRKQDKRELNRALKERRESDL